MHPDPGNPGDKQPGPKEPDGWDSARFLDIFLNFGSFPFSSLVLPSRR
jgi:hypothetical protein